MTPQEKACFIDQLAEWVEQVDNYRTGFPAGQQPGLTRLALVAGAEIISKVCGEDAIQAAYPFDNSSPSDSLDAFARRAEAASYLFGMLDRKGSAGSLTHAADEARVIARGDRPRLFEPIGRKVAVRVARKKLRALEWEAYLTALGATVADARADILRAFGQDSWNTVEKWKKQVDNIYGDGATSASVRRAFLLGHAGHSFHGVSRSGDHSAALSADGDVFRKEARANIGSV